MNAGLALAATALAIAVIGLPVTVANWRRVQSERTINRFLRICTHVRVQQSRLQFAALSTGEPSWYSDPIPMLTRPGWILPEPVSLADIHLEWHNEPSGEDALTDSARREARRMMPTRIDGRRFEGYSEALVELNGMSDMFNGFIYRPIEMSITGDELRLKFAAGRYFDFLDTTEVLSYEAAARDLARRDSLFKGKYRKYLGDPFDLSRRTSSFGVITLTIRRGEHSCGFFMHKRDNNRRLVIAAPEVMHVIPAGEFTPADVGLEAQQEDFDLWRTIMREYAEEFFNVEEAYGRGGRPIDYNNDWPFNELGAARRSHELNVYVFGIGLDPLTWKTEILAVCVIEANTFDRIFAKMVDRDSEGTIIVGPKKQGIPLNAENIERYIASINTRSAARACLILTWRHRVTLELPV